MSRNHYLFWANITLYCRSPLNTPPHLGTLVCLQSAAAVLLLAAAKLARALHKKESSTWKSSQPDPGPRDKPTQMRDSSQSACLSVCQSVLSIPGIASAMYGMYHSTVSIIPSIPRRGRVLGGESDDDDDETG